MSNKNTLAIGQCSVCNRTVKRVGSSEKDAEEMLRHDHQFSGHPFNGFVATRMITAEEARKIEKEAA